MIDEALERALASAAFEATPIENEPTTRVRMGPSMFRAGMESNGSAQTVLAEGATFALQAIAASMDTAEIHRTRWPRELAER